MNKYINRTKNVSGTWQEQLCLVLMGVGQLVDGMTNVLTLGFLSTHCALKAATLLCSTRYKFQNP